MSFPLDSELRQARRQTDELFRIVREDSLYERPIPERHRLIFYLGHLEAFDRNLLAQDAQPSSDPTLDRLFAFGIDPVEGDLPDDRPEDWPALAEVERYSRRTRGLVDGMLPRVPEELLHAAIEHRLMHAETLAYILHQLPYERKQRPEEAVQHGNVLPPSRPSPEMIHLPARSVELGRAAGEGFSWDNEYQAHSVEVPAFSIAKYKVTNGEYLEFVREGGLPPFFWEERSCDWFYRGMFQEMPLPLDWPVYVTKCQAEAYANWRGLALPTEAQYQRAAAGAIASRNVDFRSWEPVPVTADDTAELVPMQLAGNGWEWTTTVFGPFPGFQPRPYYPNYSAPFFDGQHFVLKGGSARTAACFLRPSFRNWFRPSYPYIYATFRLVAA